MLPLSLSSWQKMNTYFPSLRHLLKKKGELILLLSVVIFLAVSILLIIVFLCLQRESEEETTTTTSPCCRCWNRIREVRQQQNVRDFDNLQDLLLDLEQNETGRVLQSSQEPEQEDSLEASLETFFPNLLEISKKKNKKKYRRRPEGATPEEPGDGDNSAEEPLL
jgi:flagellar basal body-associated protein FliL